MQINSVTTEPCHQIRKQNVEAWAAFVEAAVSSGSEASLLTFMFTNLNHDFAGVSSPVDQMRDAVEHFYRSLVTRIVRQPKLLRNRDRLPVLLAAIDSPVATRRRSGTHEIGLNSGLHAHGVLLVRPNSRLRVRADEHVRENRELYMRDQRLMRVDARPIRHSPARALEYAFKSVERGTVSYDDGVLILPRALAEVRGSTPSHA